MMETLLPRGTQDFSVQVANPNNLKTAIELFTSGALQFHSKTIRKHGSIFSKEVVLEQMKTLFEPHFKAYE